MSTIGLCDRTLVSTCISLTSWKENARKDGVSDPSTEENRERNQIAKKEFAIRLLQRRLKWLKMLLDSAETNRTLELDAQVRSLASPDEGASDRVLRYETHLDRQLYRALDQLERLQRRRNGESVPPPLNFNLGGHRVFAKQSQ